MVVVAVVAAAGVVVEAVRVAVAAAAVVVAAVPATGLDGRGVQVLWPACFLVVAARLWGVPLRLAVLLLRLRPSCMAGCFVCVMVSVVGALWLLSCCCSDDVVWCFGEGFGRGLQRVQQQKQNQGGGSLSGLIKWVQYKQGDRGCKAADSARLWWEGAATELACGASSLVLHHFC